MSELVVPSPDLCERQKTKIEADRNGLFSTEYYDRT